MAPRQMGNNSKKFCIVRDKFKQSIRRTSNERLLPLLYFVGLLGLVLVVIMVFFSGLLLSLLLLLLKAPVLSCCFGT